MIILFVMGRHTTGHQTICQYTEKNIISTNCFFKWFLKIQLAELMVKVYETLSPVYALATFAAISSATFF